MAAATPKTPSDAQPTSENITYEATLNAAASASRFPAGAFLDYAGLKKILEALAEMYATGDRPTEGLAYASLATTAAAPRGPTSFQVSSHEAFLEKLDGELAKCDDFAHREVVKVKRELAELESGGSRPRSGSLDGDPEEVEGWRVDAVGQHFLEVEKYVNWLHGFLPLRRCALVPIPVHAPDLSRPLRGPYESPRPNPRVQANDGANPYGGVRPLTVPHIQ